MPRRHSDSQEFSRFIEADSVGAKPIERDISANAEERAALAERFDLVAINRLEADFTLRRAGNGVIHVKGRVQGDVVQSCVLTLEPVPARIEEAFAADFAAEAGRSADDEEIDFEAADPPEPIRNGHIDLGELAAEQLFLALDPYPRAPGAELPQGSAPEEPAAAPVNPFSILKK
jgi:uncharacterized metal-binding protein YceD (DUF177 family)